MLPIRAFQPGERWVGLSAVGGLLSWPLCEPKVRRACFLYYTFHLDEECGLWAGSGPAHRVLACSYRPWKHSGTVFLLPLAFPVPSLQIQPFCFPLPKWASGQAQSHVQQRFHSPESAILARTWFAETGISTPWLLAEEKVVPEWPMRSWGAGLRRNTGRFQGLTKQQNGTEAQPSA